jgi:hypothetical protein
MAAIEPPPPAPPPVLPDTPPARATVDAMSLVPATPFAIPPCPGAHHE